MRSAPGASPEREAEHRTLEVSHASPVLPWRSCSGQPPALQPRTARASPIPAVTLRNTSRPSLQEYLVETERGSIGSCGAGAVG